MNEEHVHDFFLKVGAHKYFHQSIALHESPDVAWETAHSLCPLLPRGWYELAQLSPEDRIEFTYEYWQMQLPVVGSENMHFEKRLRLFFENLEEIGIYITQVKKRESFDANMVYSLKRHKGFFQGCPPASEESLEALSKRFGNLNLPPDYLAFLRIHDGFSKYTDTGLIKTRDLAQVYQRLQHLLEQEVLVRPDGQAIHPGNIIPFYESFGLHCYQCFYADWYPTKDMGNVYFSEHDRTMSNFLESHEETENLAFSTFIGWLIFYLEDAWHV